MNTVSKDYIVKPVYSSHLWAEISGLIKQVAVLHRSLCMHVNDTYGDCFNGQFRQVTILYSDLIRQVSLYK